LHIHAAQLTTVIAGNVFVVAVSAWPATCNKKNAKYNTCCVLAIGGWYSISAPSNL